MTQRLAQGQFQQQLAVFKPLRRPLVVTEATIIKPLQVEVAVAVGVTTATNPVITTRALGLTTATETTREANPRGAREIKTARVLTTRVSVKVGTDIAETRVFKATRTPAVTTIATHKTTVTMAATMMVTKTTTVPTTSVTMTLPTQQQRPLVWTVTAPLKP